MHELAAQRIDAAAGEFVDDAGIGAHAVFRNFQDSGKTFSAGRLILRNMEATLNARVQPLTGMQWLILATAGLGFAFDIYEVVVQAIVLRPVLVELGGFAPGSREFNHWAGLMLFAPVVLGGLASLAGGYLTDRLGRQRVLVWSIVLYGAAAFMSGLATSLGELIVWRCITVAGACVEFVAAIAWLTELFPDSRRREAASAGRRPAQPSATSSWRAPTTPWSPGVTGCRRFTARIRPGATCSSSVRCPRSR